ncbi:MAG: hypothetical protein QG582_6, partial [Candidatus Thermoplasmatota archaeon]|nr:hypothetical protein [Candidatus Thermoplasmatota archaeon]
MRPAPARTPRCPRGERGVHRLQWKRRLHDSQIAIYRLYDNLSYKA